jgi:hypothetical protein
MCFTVLACADVAVLQLPRGGWFRAGLVLLQAAGECSTGAR